MSMSTGCCSMAPQYATCQATSLPNDLQPSEDDQLLHKERSLVWYLVSWNVRTLLDTAGSIETARQGCDQVVDVLEVCVYVHVCMCVCVFITRQLFAFNYMPV